jgi:hypothetical protein
MTDRCRSGRAALALAVAILGASAAVAPQRPAEPRDATTAILDAYTRFDLVGMNAGHGDETQDEFILSLIRQPPFTSIVNDIVVECGNRRFQPILDQFIAGDEVPLERVRPVWRDTTALMCGLSGFYDSFFSAIRDLNRSLPASRRLRVLAGDPPVDWTDIAASQGADRNASIADVMIKEVLSKHRKALMLFGVQHLFHRADSAVGRYESTYPGKTFVIDTHKGFAAFFDLERGHQLEARMRDWPAPALVPLADSWLRDLDLPYFLWPFPKRMAGESYARLVDGYLYLGPGSGLTYEPVPASILDDEAYIAELSRRFGPIDVAALRRRASDRRLFTEADRAEARQFAPGAECVGRFAATAAGSVAADIDFRNGQLAVRLAPSTEWIRLASTTDRIHFQAADGQQIEVTCQVSGLVVTAIDVTQGGVTQTLVAVPSKFGS